MVDFYLDFCLNRYTEYFLNLTFDWESNDTLSLNGKFVLEYIDDYNL